MDNASYTITETAEILNLRAKTIRRYIKSGKLSSVKVPTKFGDEYRVTEIPEEMRKEAAQLAEAQSKVDIVPMDDLNNRLDSQQLYQENIRLAAQLGAATERIRQLEDQVKIQEKQLSPAQERIRELERQMILLESLEGKIKLLEAPRAQPKLPWWKRMFGVNN